MSKFEVPPLWGYPPAPVSTRYRGPEPFVFNGLLLPAMWRARSVEVSATTASPVRSGRTGPEKHGKRKRSAPCWRLVRD